MCKDYQPTRTVGYFISQYTLLLDQLWLPSVVWLSFGVLANKHSGEQCIPHCWWSLLEPWSPPH